MRWHKGAKNGRDSFCSPNIQKIFSISQSLLKLGHVLSSGPWTMSRSDMSVQFSSVAQSCPTLCDPMDCSTPPCPSPTPGAYSNTCPSSQWCHPTISSLVIPLSSCLQSFPASGLFQWVSYSHQVAKVLELQLQYQSFQWIFRTDFL